MLRKLPTGASQVNRDGRAPEKDFAIALVTPLTVRCGIAEYSRQLSRAFASLDQVCVALEPSTIAAPQLGRPVAGGRRQVASIQYHPEFYGTSNLLGLARLCTAENLALSVTFHHRDLVDDRALRDLERLGADFIVHNDESLARLRSLSISRSFRLEMGVSSVADEPREVARARLGIAGGPVIGTCGFLRPHKGLTELIRTVSLLRKTHPETTLLVLQPLYPLPESPAHLLSCVRLINALGLGDHVRLNVDFLEHSDTVRGLHACDVVVLPHAHSTEGASAAVRTALAAGRPVVTSRSQIFSDVAGVVLQSEDTTPAALGAAIQDVLENPALNAKLTQASIRYAQEHDWGITATRMLEIFQWNRNG